MYPRKLAQLREKIRNRQYVMTLHAEEEMDDDNLSIFDIESSILSGDIRERQKDEESAEWKYVIEGRTLTGGKMAVVVKMSITNRLVIITVWRE